MFCRPHCSVLSTILFSAVTTDPGSTIFINIVHQYQQCNWQQIYPTNFFLNQKTVCQNKGLIHSAFAIRQIGNWDKIRTFIVGIIKKCCFVKSNYPYKKPL